MNSTSLVASVSSRLSRLGDAIAEFFDQAQNAIILLNSLLRRERERLLHKSDVDLEAHDQNVPRDSGITVPQTVAGNPRRCMSCGTVGRATSRHDAAPL